MFKSIALAQFAVLGVVVACGAATMRDAEWITGSYVVPGEDDYVAHFADAPAPVLARTFTLPRKDVTRAVDFVIISHNHLDHYTREFYRAMDKRHKTVFQNFECNYGAALNIVNGKLADTFGGYSYGECKYNVKDVTIRTYVSDHNPILRKFVMPVEVHIGNYTILHSGDTHDVQNLRPVRTPDMWIHLAWCWGGCFKRDEWADSETVRGIRAFHPRLAVVSHFQELTHSKPGRRTFNEAQDRKTTAEEEGIRALVPFWGDRMAL